MVYSTTYIAEETVSFLKNHAAKQSDEPFFLQVSFPDPHAPLTPPGRYWDPYNPEEVNLPESYEHVDPVEPLFVQKIRESYGTPKKVPAPITPDEKEAREIIALTYGSISMIDDPIGKILAALEEGSLTENTIVIFTADHGDIGGDHGLFGKFGIHYEAVLKVPFIWKDPENKEMGRVDQLGGTIDIGSSILARADAPNVYGTQEIDIVSFSQSKEEPNRHGIFIEEDQHSEQVNGMGSQRIWLFYS
jgi:arylsulfatase A-like enzyme